QYRHLPSFPTRRSSDLQATRPALREHGCQPWLELLYRATGLEPDDAIGEHHAQHRRPRPLVLDRDLARRAGVWFDPGFGRRAIRSEEHTSELQSLRHLV